MDVQLLIDAVVRQTMVLIAQLSTTAGSRSPLTHVADRVFLDLVDELERQRVGKKVIADMFGLALRSYQQKVQRLSESATDRGMTLWAAVNEFVAEKGVVSKPEVLLRFRNDDHVSVRGILNDLVASGLVFRTGRGEATIYRHAAPEDLAQFAPLDPVETRASLVWVLVHRQGPVSSDALAQELRLDADEIERALERLLADGRIRAEEVAGERVFRADQCIIPLGSRAGWEAAIVDHHRALVTALLAKLRAGGRSAAADDEIGGSTFTFDLWPGHSCEAKTRGLLARLRAELLELWDEVDGEPMPAGMPRDRQYRVTFYCGQSLESELAEEES